MVLARVARQAGYEVEEAGTYEAARRLMGEGAYACVTLDLSLGEHGGLDVLQHLAQIKFDAPIIVVSGSDDKVREEALMVARRLGLNVCGSFGKPMNLSHLRNLLGEIRKRQARRADPARGLTHASMTDVSTITGPSAAPERTTAARVAHPVRAGRERRARDSALAVIWAGALLAGDGILANASAPCIAAARCRVRRPWPWSPQDRARSRACGRCADRRAGGVPAAFSLAVARGPRTRSSSSR